MVVDDEAGLTAEFVGRQMPHSLETTRGVSHSLKLHSHVGIRLGGFEKRA